MTNDSDPNGDRHRVTLLTRLSGSNDRKRLLAAAAVVAVCTVAALFLWPRAGATARFQRLRRCRRDEAAFFSHLAPAIRAENRRVLDQRQRLLEIVEDFETGAGIGWLDRRWLKNLAEEYALEWDEQDLQPTLELLRRRVDMVPLPLALVQAATESGWGRSRFAAEGNNLFGQWCYTRGCGLTPANRRKGAQHEVAAFDSVRDAVASYLRNLNAHDAYLPLRRLRQQQREAGQIPRAEALIDGLIRYSERREENVEEIRTVLRTNRPIIEEVIESA
ncbi:MAG: glucosaminidase domain-containing protein [Halioglobus sp.]|nr:glucosaminidase domain-containing protein [Halioglobus sp.]